MAALLIVGVLFLALAVLGYRFGADSRDGASAPRQRWIAHPYDE